MLKKHNVNIGAYFSHSIRGAKGLAATADDMALNCGLALVAANMLRQACPVLELYVPAEHEDYVQTAYDRGSHNEEEILAIDCEILTRRDILIGYCHKGVTSRGMQVEIKHAMEKDIPVFTFEKVDEVLYLSEQILEWYYDTHVS
jgi:hypothetical protein